MNAWRDLSYAWRSLRRAPVFSATVTLTLTIGIGSAAAIFAVVNAVLLRPLPYGHPERLVGAWHDLPPLSKTHAPQTAGTYFTYKKLAHTIEGIALYDDGSASVSDPDGRADPEQMLIARTTGNLMPLLEVSPLIGRSFSEADDAPKGPPVAIISEDFWRARFAADKNVLGKRLIVDGASTEIVGVMPASFRFPNARTRMWLPHQLDPNDPNPGGFNYNAVARLKPGVTVQDAERDFANVLPRVVEISPNVTPTIPTKIYLDQTKPVPSLVPMRDDVVGDIARTLWIVAATAALVLLVTCANVANLLLVRADERHRELSVRAALGAGRGQVLAHFFSESVVLTAISILLALGVAAIGIRLLVSAGPAGLPRLAEVHADWTVVAFTVVLGILVALAYSVIPAIRFTHSDTLSGLHDAGRGGTAGGHRQRARGFFVATQMAFTLVVLAASGLLLRSFQRLHAVRPGYIADDVATLWLSLPANKYPGNADAARFWTQLTERASQLPGVQAVGLTGRLPLEPQGMTRNPMWIEGDETSKKVPPLQLYSRTDGGYFKAMGIPLLAGQTFDPIERQIGDAAIISQETATRFFHDSTGRAALGKRFRSVTNGPWRTIIGVVGTTRDTSLSAAPTPVIYLPQALTHDSIEGRTSRLLAVVVRTNQGGDVSAMTRAVQRVIREIDPTLPTFDVQSMRATVSASMARLSFVTVVIGVAAAVTLVLGVVGLYGVIAYIVTLRTRELGVRIALGAEPRSVVAMVTKQALVLCGAGVVAGLALVVVVARYLRSFLFEVAPTDPATLAAATVVLVACAMLSSWIPARRAGRVNPMEALRAD